MTTFRKGVPKPTLVGAGAPNPKKGAVNIIYADDVDYFPPRDENGILMVGNIVLKANAKVYTVYHTPTTQKGSHTTEGDEDAEQIKQKFEGSVPGDELEVNEFEQNALGQGFIILYGTSCGSNSNKCLGTPCNPMKLKGEFTDDKDGVKRMFTFEQLQGGRQLAGIYTGSLSFASNFNVPLVTTVVVSPDNGNVYQLPSTAVEASVTFTGMTQTHGQIISLVGGGGVGPSVLHPSAAAPATVLLANGADWVALAGAIINLRVFIAGGTKYLIEISRK